MSKAKKARLAERRAMTTNTTENIKFMGLVDETLDIIFKNEDDNAFKKLRQNYTDEFSIKALAKDIVRMANEIVRSIEHNDCEMTFNLYAMDILNRNNMTKEVRYCLNFWYTYGAPDFDWSYGSLFEIIMDFNDIRKLYRKIVEKKQIA